jgi:hypothetical protein
MTPSPADRDPTAPATVAGAAKVTGWGLAVWGGVQLAAQWLERTPMALALVQAALAEWGSGRMGIAWSDPLAPAPSPGAIGRRVARGAAAGGAAAVLVMGTALATRGATIENSPPSLELLAVGLLASALAAIRDELLLRGVVLRVARGLVPTWACLLACGAAAAAARFGVDGTLTASVAADGLRAIALGALWVHDRGAWMACAANASWTWTLGSLAHGGVAEVRFATEPDAAASSLVVLAMAAFVASMSIRRRRT